MANEFEHKNWGVTDFKRYHNGSMPDMERHALEKASLEDPFLQDALDGYSYAAQPEEDLVEIQEKLWPAQQKEKARLIWFKRKNTQLFLKAAAIFILIAGISWLYISYNNKKPGSEEASNRFASLEKTEFKPTDSAGITDSKAIDPDKAIATIPGNQHSEKQNNVVETQVSASAPALEDEAINRVEYDRRDSVSIASAPAAEVNKALSGKVAGVDVRSQNNSRKESAKDMNVIAGKVVDANGQPVPYANVTIQTNKIPQGVAADANGNFVVRNNNASDDKILLQANAAGYETTNAAVANNSTNNNIVLNENNNQLSEVVVTGYDKSKKSKSANASASKQQLTKWNASNSRVIVKGVEPLKGWPHFYSFMNDSTALHSKLIGTNGFVLLQFKVDSTGKAMDIMLTRSLTDSANQISKELLKQAPLFKPLKANKKAEARFIFN
jgi:hypothetical protein